MAVANLLAENAVRARRRRGGLILESSFSVQSGQARQSMQPPPAETRQRPSRDLVYENENRTSVSAQLERPSRKDRRHCADFSYDKPYDQDVCAKFSPSLVTTPSDTYSGSGSDTSSLPDFNFPEPPPLRRMKSSPFFSLDDTNSPLADLLENALKMSAHMPSVYSGLGANNVQTRRLESQGEALLRQDIQREREKRRLWSTESRLRAASSPDLHDATATNFVTTFPPLPPLPPQNSEPHRLTKMRSLRFASDCNTSSDRLDVRIRPTALPPRPKTTNTLHKGKSLSMEYLAKRVSRSTPFTPRSSRPTGQPQMHGRPQTRHRPNHSTSFVTSSSSHVNQLGTPFLHRSMPAAPRPIHIDSPDSQRSFMDFSVEKDVHSRRTAFRKLMSRASVLIGWKKQPMKKPTSIPMF